MKRYLVEWGYGTDIHGGDVTKAAKLAVKNALSHCCLCGITELVGLKDPEKMLVKVRIACPHPEQVDIKEVLALLPIGKVKMEEVAQGGMTVPGMYHPDMGEGDQIVIALAALTVCLDV